LRKKSHIALARYLVSESRDKELKKHKYAFYLQFFSALNSVAQQKPGKIIAYYIDIKIYYRYKRVREYIQSLTAVLPHR